MGDTIIGVQFGIANPDDIISRSVVEVKTDKTYQGDIPVINGVFDPRFGVTEQGKSCPTCKQSHLLCPGHFGHIRLARPVYLYQFIEVIQKVLAIVCISCSNPYLPDDYLENISQDYKGTQRFNAVRESTTTYKESDLKESSSCGHCGSQLIKKVTRADGNVTALQAMTYKENSEPFRLQPELVLRCFQRITDKHIDLIGFNPKFSRPEWMLCTVLAVPPLTVRPSVIMEDNQRSEDDLTHKLIDIIRQNNSVRDKIDKGESADIINKFTDLLQIHVATYVDNDIKGMPPAAQRSGRPLKTLKARFGAKDGRVRGNLMGKRVDFSARSVITPDPNIEVDQLGVPEEIASNLTFPEIVTPYNRDRLLMYVRNGPQKYPGAKTIEFKADGRRMHLGFINRENVDLKEGDIVHRHLVDNDVVLFNRQPSLHKMSMMCHRIRILPYSTFRLNVSATKPYNADFDGDEMNMHVPQSVTAATELKMLASLLRQIISPRTSAPIIQVFQDTLTGVYRISDNSVSIPEHIAMNMLARMKRPLSSFKRIDKPISGKDVISNAFPLMNFKSGSVEIKDGHFTSGRLDKGSLGKASKGIIHTIFNDFGHERTGDFINSVQNIVTKFNMFSGFSTGPSDLIANIKTTEEIELALQKGRSEVSKILSDMHSGRFINNEGRSNGEQLELQITKALNEINSTIGNKAVSSLPSSNRMLQMTDNYAGSKGSALNITQMMALLGQQLVDGKRIKYTMDNRTLPHFTKFDDGPESRGFVENSFISGIRPTEFFFHAMGGREGLIDTAVKTSDTGYIQRKLVKLMEDIHVDQDYTVRDINGCIVQFLYSEDGIDSTCVEIQECDLAILTLEQLYSNFGCTKEDFKSVCKEVSDNPPDLIEQIIEDRKILINNIFRFQNKTEIRAPVHFNRLIAKYKNPYSVKTDLTPDYVVSEIEKLTKTAYIQSNKLFHILLRFNLAPKKSIIINRFSKELFDELISEIKFRYMKSLVHPGEMVGPLAAQSIGEPTTQLTLNTFHTAGTTKANATQGVPRIRELLDVSENPKNPSNVIYLNPELSLSQANALNMMKVIQKTTLRDITKSVRIYYDPNPLSSDTLVQEDREILKDFEKFSLTKGCASPWIMRLELDEQKIAERRVIDMTLIQSKIENNKVLKVFECIHSDINSEKLVLRVTFGIDIARNALSLRFIEDKLLDTILTGVDGIGRVFPREINDELVYDEKIGGYRPMKQHVLDSEGSNLLELFTKENVDCTRSFSDDIHEILNIFGIETARMTLYEELMKVFVSEYINYHHLCLLVDAMTYHGHFVEINRFGMSKLDNGVLAKSSFEQTSKILFDAAVSGEFDTMRGVSANIMFGQIPPCGTGFVDILIDESKLPEGDDEINIEEEDLKHANEFVKSQEEKGECRLDDILMAW